MNKHHLNSKGILNKLLYDISELPTDGSYEIVINKIANQRTYLQNNAIHKYLTMLTDEFNNSGLTVQQVLAVALEREWTMIGAKEQIWKPIQGALFETESTTKLERDQVSEVYSVIDRHTGEKFGLHVPFPSRELQ